MQPKKLHLVSFDNPFPPNYGGVIEVYYKIKALHRLGVQIYLHCFYSDRNEVHPDLESYTQAIYFYKTSNNPLYFFSRFPFSVLRRSSKKWLQRIADEPAPILFESYKTIWCVHDAQLSSCNKFLRVHNIESNYYSGLASSESRFWHKCLYRLEAKKFRDFETSLNSFERIFTLSQYEQNYFNKLYDSVDFIPVFHGNEKVHHLEGFGQYALYHGDLRMADNLRAVRFLIETFKELPHYKLVIASNSSQKKVTTWIGSSTNITYESIKSPSHLQALFHGAHLNLLYSFQQSGTKLKLLNALFNSRFCVINNNITDDSVVAGLCTKAHTKSALKDVVTILFQTPYNDYELRKEQLEKHRTDLVSAKTLIEKIYKE